MNNLSPKVSPLLANFSVTDSHACFRPVGHMTFQEAVSLACTAITYARENGLRRLFIDSTQLTGFDSPATWERFEMGMQCAEAAKSMVIVAVVMRAELIDPDRFGVKVARNRGLQTNVFAEESEALEWLLDPRTRQGAD